MTRPAIPGVGLALARYRSPEGVRLGLVSEDRIRPLTTTELGAPSLNDFLSEPLNWERLRARVGVDSDEWIPLSSVSLAAPVEPRQVVQAGANYRQHVIDLVVAHREPDDPRTESEARSQAADMMDERARRGTPYFFVGAPQSVVGDEDPLVLPGYSDKHDWELELAVVIGRRAFRVTRETAMEHVGGYTIANDITTRDLVFLKEMKELGTDWYRSKNAPGFLPTGPLLVPPFAAPDPTDMRLELRLNGELMQDASPADLLFDIPALIAAASATSPLLPGDLLLTGSPAGNGASRGRLLRDGDVMEGTISGLGTQIVRCIAEPAGWEGATRP
ncbi:MAG: fumarylacetoacetate hydrolase protein [Microbacteriaceae bacterium]|nr:fumarylacetoacetate hydrolase protein [Microbacteriaceae bacterium]